MNTRFGRSLLALLILNSLVAAGCATSKAASAPKAIASIADIAGAWTGTLEFGAGEQPCTLTIEPGGRASIVGRTMTAYGEIKVRDGKATYSFPARSDGAVTLYEGAGQRQLQLKGTSGAFDVRVTPAGPR